MKKEHPLEFQSKTQLVKINLKTGELARKNDKEVILESFAPNTRASDYINKKSSGKLKTDLPRIRRIVLMKKDILDNLLKIKTSLKVLRGGL